MRRSLVLLAGLLAGCATAARQAYVAPSEETVRTTLEEGHGESPSQVVWIQNGSSVPIVVYSVTLRSCENVKQSCEPTPLNLRLGPGRREILRRVEPRDRNASFSFRYSFGWRADSAGTQALTALAQQGSASAGARLAAMEEARAERRAQVGAVDEELGPEQITALGPRVAALQVKPDSLVMHPGQVVLVHQLRVLVIGPEHETLGRVRAYRWRVDGAAAARVAADTVEARAPGRATLEVRLPDALFPGRTPPSARVPIVVLE